MSSMISLANGTSSGSKVVMRPLVEPFSLQERRATSVPKGIGAWTTDHTLSSDISRARSSSIASCTAFQWKWSLAVRKSSSDSAILDVLLCRPPYSAKSWESSGFCFASTTSWQSILSRCARMISLNSSPVRKCPVALGKQDNGIMACCQEVQLDPGADEMQNCPALSRSSSHQSANTCGTPLQRAWHGRECSMPLEKSSSLGMCQKSISHNCMISVSGLC
mmetsp:Transcript_33882/g.77318  ORF Transcript_33882/g.77318 Transcript_33882/m.77318 type:complete len:221 (-) Transcript_33882:73-735(-)